ncbi:MAG: hypothetical protein AMJ63_17325 [Myxococcales bacterium SG8_38_1]|jgi:hypothetical protein|nr:MAG: hypothetical protein AMJ63_17325 [Myxococcales bacterium SG8_38_1]
MTMKTRFPILLGLLLAIAALSVPSRSSAQQPKMDIKLFFGASATTFVSMLETGRERDTFAGWQIGFGPRVRKRVWFVEVLFSFNRWAFSFSDPSLGAFEGQVNSFELPLNAGYVPYKNSLFKLYLYGGLVNHFNTKIIATLKLGGDLGDITLKLRPKEVDFAVYQALARFGVNVDIAMFNLDFNYSISMNGATKTSYRTGYHQLQLNIAYLF